MRFYNRYIQILIILIGTVALAILARLICSLLPRRIMAYNEGMENMESGERRCPNMLIERENNFFLYNSKIAIVPGVNPIQFKSLEEYSEFLDWQRGQGINCPVLELKYSTDPQGNDVYKIKPNIFRNQGGLPNSNTSDGELGTYSDDISPILDANPSPGIHGYDPENQYIGVETPIDRIPSSNSTPSMNPMDTDWGGASYTQKKLENTK